MDKTKIDAETAEQIEALANQIDGSGDGAPAAKTTERLDKSDLTGVLESSAEEQPASPQQIAMRDRPTEEVMHAHLLLQLHKGHGPTCPQDSRLARAVVAKELRNRGIKISVERKKFERFHTQGAEPVRKQVEA